MVAWHTNIVLLALHSTFIKHPPATSSTLATILFMELLNKIVDVILSPLLSVVAEHTSYLFKAGDAVRSLEDATKKLLDWRDDVKEKIQIAEREGRAPTHAVEGWLERVKEIQTEVAVIVHKYDQRSRCLRDFSLDCWQLYSTGKNASNKLQDVEKLHDNGAFNDIAVQLPPPLVQEVPTTPNASLKADPNLQLALHYLKHENVGMVGIWGMGGVGKTHLLKQINNSFTRDSTFHTVIFITASKDCSNAKLQNEIVKRLGLTPHDDMESQGRTILEFLKKRSFLLLLDDLWERHDLQAVGIPFPLGIDSGFNRKVVITTRSAEVCGLMDVRKRLKVECLEEEEARTLFVEKASNETINSDPLIPDLARQVVQELDGLPLALITIGRSMYTKKNPRAWENAIHQLHKSHLHEIEAPGTQDSIFHRLKFSYDSLGSGVSQQCFLSCALWPEDFHIPKGELIRCWIGLGLIDEFDMREAYNSGYTLLGRLQDVSLIEEGGDGVKMHDVIRDMALWIACDCGKTKSKWVVQAGVGLKETKWREDWLEAERISLSNNCLQQLPSNAPCPNKLSTLMLHSNYLSTLENIFIFTSLAYLDLAYNFLDHFPIEICRLINLQYLNLSNNCLGSLPKELESLINLKHLLLRNCGVHMIPEGVIPRLKSLRELDLYSPHLKLPWLHHPSWLVEELEGLHNLSVLGIDVDEQSQLERLSELSNVSILHLAVSGMSNPAILSSSSNFLGSHSTQMNLTTLTIICWSMEEIVFENTHRNPNWHLHCLETLNLLGLHCLTDIVWRGLLPKDCFKRLEGIHVFKCTMLENMAWVRHLPCLKWLTVEICNNMKELVKSTTEEEDCSQYVQSLEEDRDQKSVPTFPCLKKLVLSGLPQLCGIGDPTLTFPSLEQLRVWNCPKLKRLPFRLHNMPEKLRGISCNEEWWNNLEWEDANIKTSLQPLCHF